VATLTANTTRSDSVCADRVTVETNSNFNITKRQQLE